MGYTNVSIFVVAGFVNTTVCDDCGSYVHDTRIHDRWHEGLERVADDAGWGGMLRPIG